MLLRTFILLSIIAASSLVQAQHTSLIGKTKDQVQEIIKKEFRDFGQDQSIIRQQFNYLKYVNASQSITWILYFSDQDTCTSTKKVCDYIEYDSVLKELDAQYQRTGDMEWEFQSDEKPIQLLLTEEDWYFTIREQVRQ